MVRILILGSAGMLGHVVCRYFEGLGKYEVIDASFPNEFRKGSKILDVTDAARLKEYLETIRPDILINCIGLLIRGSQDEPANAIYINAWLPHFLSKIIHAWNGKLVHISTDCVFSGSKGSYTEIDEKDAKDIYGRSKALGEVENDKDLTIRTSIIGPELKKKGEGLFHWFMNQAGNVNGYTRVYWSGLTTLELAKVIDAAIVQNLSGLVNVSAMQKISKYELLTLIHRTFSFPDVTIIPFDQKMEDKSLVSVRTDFTYAKKDYPEMIQELFAFMRKNGEYYPGYLSPGGKKK